MTTPKSLIAHLHKHWEIIKELVWISREHLSFDDGFLRQITQQLEQDRHAVLELAEQAKKRCIYTHSEALSCCSGCV